MGNIFIEDFRDFISCCNKNNVEYILVEGAQYFTEENVLIRYLHLNSLIQAKRASGRHRDIDDIEQLSKK